VGSNVLLPAVARAQFVAASGASTSQVLAALVGQEVAATRYTASATSGAAFSSSATLPAVLDMAGADNQIGTDGTQILIGPTASTTCIVKMGASLRFLCNGTAEINGPLDQYNAGFFKNTIGGAVKVDDAEGMNIAAKALGTCGASREGDILRDTAAGGSTTGERTRLCMCGSDGAGTPAYAWQNLVSGTTGTTTTCPN
jgi:hypothetical protein